MGGVISTETSKTEMKRWIKAPMSLREVRDNAFWAFFRHFFFNMRQL